MKINVGSKNPVKVEAVREMSRHFDYLFGYDVKGYDVESGVSAQPIGLEEMRKGARTRAERALSQGGEYGIGLEDGIIPIDDGIRFLNTTYCFVTDGKKEGEGIGSGFMMPFEAGRLIMEKGLEASDALREAGITNHSKIGYGTGIIYLLTNERYTRKKRVKEAIEMALVRFNHPEHYEE